MSTVRANLADIRHKEQSGDRPGGTADACVAAAIELIPDADQPTHARLKTEDWQRIIGKPSKLSQAANLARSAAHGAKSAGKTALGIDRASDQQYRARLSVCETCEHATRHKGGSLHSCGPMLRSMKDKGLKTCGCVLRLKARDLREDCPVGKWPGIG